MGAQTDGGDDDRRAHQAHEGPGELAVDALGGLDDDEDGHADGERPPVGVAEVPHHVRHPVHGRPRRRRQGEEVGELVHDDDHGHTGEEPGDDGSRQEVGDPPQAQQAHDRHEHAHGDRQQRHQGHVVRRTGGRDVGDPGREERGDGGVGAHRQLGGRSQHGEGHGPRDEGVEARDGGHPRQAGGGELLGDGDDEQGQPGEQVRAHPLPLVAVHRAEQRRHLVLGSWLGPGVCHAVIGRHPLPAGRRVTGPGRASVARSRPR